MTVGQTWSMGLVGVQGTMVKVEADAAQGLPAFTVSGLPDTACRQSPERVRSAAQHTGVALPQRRITVNLSPAGLPKAGTAYDLPIAVATLEACGVLRPGSAAGVAHLGELGLDGSVRPVPGVLPCVLAAARAGLREVVVPRANAREARLVPDVTVYAVASLRDVLLTHTARATGDTLPLDIVADEGDEAPEDLAGLGRVVPDLADVAGQHQARHALEVAAAGRHHLCLVGPPGAGKTMLAQRLPGILPPLDTAEALEVTSVHSVLGVLDDLGALVRHPPFVAPHHGSSMAAVVGGGSGRIRPGAISRAHCGVLFLDEAPEFRRDVLEALRQPAESGSVTIARGDQVLRMPARFQLVLAANPCPCGKGWGKGADCTCSPTLRRHYGTRLSGPLMDRIDLHLFVPPIKPGSLHAESGESSADVAQRVLEARARQARRLTGTPWRVNADVPGAEIRSGVLRPPADSTTALDHALDTGGLTIRGYHRVIRVAWTLADLAGHDRPTRADIAQALVLRSNSLAAAA